MRVKKAGGRIFGGAMSAAEKKAMDLEIQRQLAEYDRKHLIEIDAAHRRERRRMAIAKCDGMYWSAIITYRGSVIRIISARPSTEKEKRPYDKNRYRNNR